MNIKTDWRVVVEPNELMRRGLVNLISGSGNSNCAAFDSIEMMEKEAPRRIEWVDHAFVSGQRAA